MIVVLKAVLRLTDSDFVYFCCPRGKVSYKEPVVLTKR